MRALPAILIAISFACWDGCTCNKDSSNDAAKPEAAPAEVGGHAKPRSRPKLEVAAPRLPGTPAEPADRAAQPDDTAVSAAAAARNLDSEPEATDYAENDVRALRATRDEKLKASIDSVRNKLARDVPAKVRKQQRAKDRREYERIKEKLRRGEITPEQARSEMKAARSGKSESKGSLLRVPPKPGQR